MSVLLYCQIHYSQIIPNGLTGTVTRSGVCLDNKPTDLSVCVNEESEYEGGVVVKLNSEKRVSTGDVRAVSEKRVSTGNLVRSLTVFFNR